MNEIFDELQEFTNRIRLLMGNSIRKIIVYGSYARGDYNNTLIEAATDCNYHTVQWDIDSLDWKDYGTQSIINEICNNKHLGNGSIILCHNGAKYILEALDTVISTLKEKGYEFVTMSELIYTEDYYMDHEGRQFQK